MNDYDDPRYMSRDHGDAHDHDLGVLQYLSEDLES